MTSILVNGVAERAIRALVENMRSAMTASAMPVGFWNYAAQHSVDVAKSSQNKVPADDSLAQQVADALSCEEVPSAAAAESSGGGEGGSSTASRPADFARLASNLTESTARRTDSESRVPMAARQLAAEGNSCRRERKRQHLMGPVQGGTVSQFFQAAPAATSEVVP